MKIPMYQVDAFTGGVFSGNPAAVCRLPEWFDDGLLQAIAAENNLSETAFFVEKEPDVELRWFTPTTEVDLCGHATLATAHVLLDHLRPRRSEIRFATRSGPLAVRRTDGRLEMDLPALPPRPCQAPQPLIAGLGCTPEEILVASHYLALFAGAEELRALQPDFAELARCHPRGVIVTAPGEDSVDFVSRFFAPSFGIDEDPVTGSAHCTLAPFWKERLGARRMRAQQVSARGGELSCEVRGDRVAVGGRCALYLEGTITVPEPLPGRGPQPPRRRRATS